MKAETVATEVPFGEGPVWCGDGTLVVTSVAAGALFRVDTARGIAERFGDGFCLDAEGRFYVASTIEHGVRVVDPDGTVVDFLEIEGDGLTTNCCFGGPDLRTLYATDAIPGNVVAWEGMPTPGLTLSTWPGIDLD
jgi:sugar lactone lactonase YvrE